MIRTKKRIRLCSILIILNLMVIWGNSLLPGSDSGAMSGGVMEFIMGLLNLPESSAEWLHTFVRKAAHFTEFACLGTLLTWRLGMAGEKHTAILPVLLAMAAALTDESIQLVTPDRGPSLADVWLDTFGAAAGMMIVLAGHHFKKRNKHKF